MSFQPETGAPYTPAVIYGGSVAKSTGSTSARTRTNSVKKRATQKQQTKVKDASGTNLIVNDATGFGLKRPYLLWNSYAKNLEANPAATPITSTTSVTMVSLITCASEPQHPLIRVRLIAVTGAGTTGEVRLVDRTSGTVISGLQVIGAASSLEFNLDGTLISPTLSGAGAPYKVDVQARTTGGANSIAVLVVYAVGIGT